VSGHVLPCAQQETTDGQIWSLFASGGASRGMAPAEGRKREIKTDQYPLLLSKRRIQKKTGRIGRGLPRKNMRLTPLPAPNIRNQVKSKYAFWQVPYNL